MYRLYYSPGACSLVIHALLYALAVPFDTSRVDLNKGENRLPDFLAVNPRGQVPVLMDGSKILRESSVIMQYLLSKHPHLLLPQDTDTRLKALEWFSFYNSTLQQAYVMYFVMSKGLKDEKSREAAIELTIKRITYLWREADAHLATRSFLCGDQPSVADLFHAVIANWTKVLPRKIEIGSNNLRLCREVSALPYFKSALSAEGILYEMGVS